MDRIAAAAAAAKWKAPKSIIGIIIKLPNTQRLYQFIIQLSPLPSLLIHTHPHHSIFLKLNQILPRLERTLVMHSIGKTFHSAISAVPAIPALKTEAIQGWGGNFWWRTRRKLLRIAFLRGCRPLKRI